MAGIFKNLDASDIRLTPFQSHKTWNSVVCYSNYWPYVNAHPTSIGTLANNPDSLYAADTDQDTLLLLDQSDNYTVLANPTITDFTFAEYRQDASQEYIAAVHLVGGFGAVSMYDNNAVLADTYTSTLVTEIKDISYSIDGTPDSYIFVAGVDGVSGQEFDHTTGTFTGGEYLMNNVPDTFTSSYIGVQAEGKLNNDKIIAIYQSGSFGTHAIAFTGSYAGNPLNYSGSSPITPGTAYGFAVYGATAYGSTLLPNELQTFLYSYDQNLYFALFDDGFLFKIDENAQAELISAGIAEILQDKSNFISGSTVYQNSKIHVVYNTGQVGLDLKAVNGVSFDKIVDARQWVARKPVVKATIQQNLIPATIGVFAGTVDDLTESVFFTINPDTCEISNPCHYGATPGDMRIGVTNAEDANQIFMGYSSSFCNRFVELNTSDHHFQLSKADYNPIPSHPSYNPLNTLFDQDSPTFDRYEPITRDGKFQRVVHKSLNHLFYQDFYSNTKATFGSGNINTQVRLLEDQAYVIDLPQSKFGEAIQPGSVSIKADYNILGSNNTPLTIEDDRLGNLYVVGGLVSPRNASVFVSESIETPTVGEWPTKDLYKYNGKGAVSITSSFNQGNWVMENLYSNVVFTNIGGAAFPIPTQLDLLGVIPTFSSSLSSSIQIKPSVVQDYRQSYNFENGDFTITMEVMPTSVPTHPSGAIVLAKQGAAEDYGININGEVISYQTDNRTPYRLRMDSSYTLHFERDGLTAQAAVSGSLTPGVLNHITAMKTGSELRIYVDSVLEQSGADIPQPKACSNKSDIWIGNTYTKDQGFDGAIDNVKIYATALDNDEIQISYHTLGRGTTYVGNVFYSHGMAVLGTIPTKFMDVLEATARGTHTIYEKEIACTVGAGEFNRSNNPTLQEYNPATNQYEFRSFTTGSDFKPYVTSIGLYNDMGDLVAIAKLGGPIKLPSNVDTTFIVRYDK